MKITITQSYKALPQELVDRIITIGGNTITVERTVVHIQCSPNEALDTELEGSIIGCRLLTEANEIVIKLLDNCLLVQERRRSPRPLYSLDDVSI